MQVNPEDSPLDIYVTWSNPWMIDFENVIEYTSPICILDLARNERGLICSLILTISKMNMNDFVVFQPKSPNFY